VNCRTAVAGSATGGLEAAPEAGVGSGCRTTNGRIPPPSPSRRPRSAPSPRSGLGGRPPPPGLGAAGSGVRNGPVAGSATGGLEAAPEAGVGFGCRTTNGRIPLPSPSSRTTLASSPRSGLGGRPPPPGLGAVGSGVRNGRLQAGARANNPVRQQERAGNLCG